jgi:hypothetical protein
VCLTRHCVAQLKLLALVRLVWAGKEVSLQDVKAVFGSCYDDVPDIDTHFKLLSKWLHINRVSTTGFDFLSRMNIETGVCPLSAFTSCTI